MKKQKERLQNKKQEKLTLRTLVDNLPDGIFLKDKESRFIFANQLIADLMGARDPSALKGKTDHDFYPKEVADAFLADERILMESRQRLVNREETESISGKLRWLTTKVPLVDSRGKVTGLLGISRIITERHEAEEKLRKSEERYRVLLEQAADGIFLLDGNGNFLMANSEFSKMTRYEPEELLGLNILDTYPEELREMAAARNDRIRSGEKLNFERVIRRKDGSVFPVEMSARKLADGKMQGIAHDITERKRTEQALTRERMFLTALMDNIPDYIYFKDRDSRFILNNRAHIRAIGAINPSEMLGKSDFDYFGPENAQKAFDEEQLIIRTGQPLVNAVEQTNWTAEKWPNRHMTWVSTTKMPLRDEKGEIIGTFGVSRDMTEHQLMEQKNLRLAAMIESSKDAIIGIGLDDEVTSWNKGAEKIFGYTADEMIGKPITPLLSPDIQNHEPTLKEKLKQETDPQQIDGSVQRKDGTKIYVSTTFSPIEDATGLLIGIIAISRDVTDQRALQVQIIRSQRLESLGTLAAGVAHQFNNINAVTKGYLDILAQDTTLPSSAQSYVKEALKGVERATEITERLQGLTSGAPTDAESLRLEVEVPRLLLLFDKKLVADGISMQIDLQETSPVRVKRAMVNFIVTSLLTNSIHALLDCQTRLITLRTRSAEGFSSLEISDTGCGIFPENLPKIFTPFFTTKGEWAEPNSPQSRVKGIGLSLAVCQSSVSESGGWIEVESTHQKGSTFRVWFPAAIEITIEDGG